MRVAWEWGWFDVEVMGVETEMAGTVGGSISRGVGSQRCASDELGYARVVGVPHVSGYSGKERRGEGCGSMGRR